MGQMREFRDSLYTHTHTLNKFASLHIGQEDMDRYSLNCSYIGFPYTKLKINYLCYIKQVHGKMVTFENIKN